MAEHDPPSPDRRPAPPSPGPGAERLWPTLGGLAALVLWSTTFALARSLAEQVGALTAGAAVYLTAGALGLARLRWTGVSWGWFLELPRKYVAGCGALFTLYTVCIYLAVGLARSREQLLEVALINYLWPAATIVLSLPLLRQKARLGLAPGTVLALAGIVLVMTQSGGLSWNAFLAHLRASPAAPLLALTAALAWAFYSNLARRWSGPVSGGAVTLFMIVTGLALLGLRLVRVETSVWTARAVLETLALGAVTGAAYGLWDEALRRGRMMLVVVCSYFTPLLSTLVSCLYLGVGATAQLWVGCAVLVAGSLLSWIAVTKKPGSSVRG